MQKPKKTIDEILDKWKLKKKVKERMIKHCWEEIVGENLYSLIKPIIVKNSILFIEVKNPSWAQHLSFLKKDLIKKINFFSKSNIVKDIKFQGSFSFEKTIEKKIEIDKKIYLQKEDLDKRNNIIKKYKGDDLVRKKIFFLLEKDYLLRIKKKNKGWNKCTECGVYALLEEKKCLFCKL